MSLAIFLFFCVPCTLLKLLQFFQSFGMGCEVFFLFSEGCMGWWRRDTRTVFRLEKAHSSFFFLFLTFLCCHTLTLMRERGYDR